MKHKIVQDRDRLVKEKIIQFRLSDYQYIIFTRACAVNCENKSEFVRDAVLDKVKSILDLKSKNSSSED